MNEPTTQPEQTPRVAGDAGAPTGRRALVWVALVALLVGAAGGYLGGRLSAGAGGDGDTTTVEAIGADAGAGATLDTPAAAGSTVDGAPATTAAGGSASSAMGGPTNFEPPRPPERLFKRTVGGAEIRVSKATGGRCSGDGCPPPQCQPVGFVSAVIVEDWDVGGGGGSIWAKHDGPARIIGTLWSGGDPVTGQFPSSSLGGFVVQAGDPVAKVRLVDAGGTTLDEMVPTSGVAVVVSRMHRTNGSFLALGVEALDAAGRVLVRLSRDNETEPMPRECLDLMRRSSSTPPSPPATVAPPKPSLPAPGQQPADRAAAERAVRAAFDAALGGRGTAEANANIDDPDGLQEARDASAKAFPQYAEPGAVRFVLDELVFTGPTRASYTYRAVVSADGVVLLSNIGTARLVDGRWLVTRATMCQILPTKPPGTC